MSQLTLRRKTDSELALQNALSTRRDFASTIDDVPLTLSFEANPVGGDRPSAPSAAVAFKLAIGDATAWIAFDDFHVFPKMTTLLGGVDLFSLPADLQLLVTEVGLESAVRTLAQALECDVAIREILPNLPPERELHHFSMVLQSGDHRSRARVAFSDDLCEQFSQAMRKSTVCAVTDWSVLPFVATVEFGRTRLSLAELKDLRSHDVVVVERTCGETPASVVLNFGPSCLVPGQFDGTTVTTTGAPRAVFDASSSDAPPDEAPPRDATQNLDSLEFEVAFNRGEVCLTLGELRALETGVRMDLMLPADGKRVGLRTGQGRLWFGELAPIGNRLGVRLLEMA